MVIPGCLSVAVRKIPNLHATPFLSLSFRRPRVALVASLGRRIEFHLDMSSCSLRCPFTVRFSDFHALWTGLSSVHPHLSDFDFPAPDRDFYGRGINLSGVEEVERQAKLTALLNMLVRYRVQPKEI